MRTPFGPTWTVGQTVIIWPHNAGLGSPFAPAPVANVPITKVTQTSVTVDAPAHYPNRYNQAGREWGETVRFTGARIEKQTAESTARLYGFIREKLNEQQRKAEQKLIDLLAKGRYAACGELVLHDVALAVAAIFRAVLAQPDPNTNPTVAREFIADWLTEFDAHTAERAEREADLRRRGVLP